MKIDFPTVLILGSVAIMGYWCFTQGPCKDLLSKAQSKVSIGSGAGARATGAAAIGDLSNIPNLIKERGSVSNYANYMKGWY